MSVTKDQQDRARDCLEALYPARGLLQFFARVQISRQPTSEAKYHTYEEWLDVQKEFQRLQDLYPPACVLPELGQKLWRTWERVVLANRLDTNDEFMTAVEASDALMSWLGEHYQLSDADDRVGEGKKESVPRARQTAGKLDCVRMILLAHLRQNYPSEPEKPLTEHELVERLAEKYPTITWNQPKVSRSLSQVFPDGGAKAYHRYFARRRVRDLIKFLEAGLGLGEKSDDPEDDSDGSCTDE